MEKIDWYTPENTNGVTVEDVIEAAIRRISLYNSKVPSRYNVMAMMDLNSALEELNARTVDRTARGVEGTTNK